MSADAQSIDDFLIALHRRGVRIAASEGRLRVEAPAGGLRQEELSLLTARKSEILTRVDQIELTATAPLRRREPGQLIPLTAAQTLWWQGRLAHGARPSARICAAAMRISGILDVDALHRSLYSLLRRHESLRTNIHTIGALAVQHVSASGQLHFEVESRITPCNGAHDAGLREIIKKFLVQPIDIASEPLLGAKLFEYAVDDHVLVLAADHMIADAASMQILNRELWALYKDETSGSPRALDDVSIHFADYAIWQQRIRPVWFFENAAYWRQRMAGAPTPKLPIADIAAAMVSRGAVVKVPFTASVSWLLREMARRERTLVSLLVLTIYAAVMARWCRQPELLMTMVVDGRHGPELTGMVGDLAYHLHLRIEVPHNVSFYDLLQQVLSEYQAACRHEDFGWVPSFVPECRDSFENVNWYFNWVPGERAEVSNVSHSGSGAVRIDKLPLDFNVPVRFLPYFANAGEHIVAVLRYGPDFFAPGEIERFGLNLMFFAGELVNNPHRRVPEYIA